MLKSDIFLDHNYKEKFKDFINNTKYFLLNSDRYFELPVKRKIEAVLRIFLIILCLAAHIIMLNPILFLFGRASAQSKVNVLLILHAQFFIHFFLFKKRFNDEKNLNEEINNRKEYSTYDIFIWLSATILSIIFFSIFLASNGAGLFRKKLEEVLTDPRFIESWIQEDENVAMDLFDYMDYDTDSDFLFT